VNRPCLVKLVEMAINVLFERVARKEALKESPFPVRI
jgi:hypothetical protein